MTKKEKNNVDNFQRVNKENKADILTKASPNPSSGLKKYE